MVATLAVNPESLRDTVKSQFYPYAEARGFIRGKSSWLSTVFRRRDDDRLRVFNIQWDKYHRPRFVLNFGETDARAISVEEGDLEIWHCQLLGRLHRSTGPTPRSWFQLNKPWLEVIRSRRWRYEPSEVVTQVIALFPEIEAWWAEKREGPHLLFPDRAV